MSNHIANLIETFENNRNPDNAFHMEKYMRNQFPFIGLKAAERRKLARPFMKLKFHEHDVDKTIRQLWELPEREYQLVAVDYLVKNKKHLEAHHIELIEYLITTKSWWDTVDAIASHLVGELFAKFPHLLENIGDNWLRSENIWLQRSMILFQLKYKEKTNDALLYSIIQQLKPIDEFFIQKAIGWALREYSKTNPTSVRNFIEKEELSNLAVREGSKYI